jgi:alkylhydroperoxidase family enzyme
MAVLDLADTSKLTGKNQEMLSRFENGLVPNMLKQMASSPAALESFLTMRESLGQGMLDEKLRAMIGIMIAEIYSCEYLLAARVAQAKLAGLTEEELTLAKQQTAKDPKRDAGLQFVRNLVLRHSDLPDGDIGELKTVGYSDGEIVELIANASFNMFAYYFVNLARPEADFPKVATAFPA